MANLILLWNGVERVVRFIGSDIESFFSLFASRDYNNMLSANIYISTALHRLHPIQQWLKGVVDVLVVGHMSCEILCQYLWLNMLPRRPKEEIFSLKISAKNVNDSICYAIMRLRAILMTHEAFEAKLEHEGLLWPTCAIKCDSVILFHYWRIRLGWAKQENYGSCGRDRKRNYLGGVGHVSVSRGWRWRDNESSKKLLTFINIFYWHFNQSLTHNTESPQRVNSECCSIVVALTKREPKRPRRRRPSVRFLFEVAPRALASVRSSSITQTERVDDDDGHPTEMLSKEPFFNKFIW